MNCKMIFSLLAAVLFFAPCATAAAGSGDEAAIRSLYTSMDRTLAANDESGAMEYYNAIVAYGKIAAVLLNDLVTAPPLSQKTYNAACSAWKAIGDIETGSIGLRYLLRSPYSDDVVKTKCLHILRAWKDLTIAEDAERLFGDKTRNENLRVAAADVLRRLEPQKAKAKFMSALDDDSEGMIIHYKAVQYLGDYKDPEVRARLKRHMLSGGRGPDLSKERALLLLDTPDKAGAADDVAEVLESTATSQALKERSINILSSPRMSGVGGRKKLEGFIKKSRYPALKKRAQRALEAKTQEDPAQGSPEKNTDESLRVKTE